MKRYKNGTSLLTVLMFNSMKYIYIEGFYNENTESVDEVTMFDSREEAIKYSKKRLELVLSDHNISSLILDVEELVTDLNGKLDKYSGHWSVAPNGTVFGIVKELK